MTQWSQYYGRNQKAAYADVDAIVVASCLSLDLEETITEELACAILKVLMPFAGLTVENAVPVLKLTCMEFLKELAIFPLIKLKWVKKTELGGYTATIEIEHPDYVADRIKKVTEGS